MHKLVRVVFVRHAQSEANTMPHIVSGRSNTSPLSALGHTQAQEAVARVGSFVAGSPIAGVLASPAVRTLTTASYFAKHGGHEVEVEHGVQELDQRSLTGRLRTEVYTQEIKDLLHSEENRLRGTVRVADEESKFDVESRMVDALHSIVGRYGNDTDDVEAMLKSGAVPSVVCYSHGVAMKCLKRHITGEDYSWHLRGEAYPNCGMLSVLVHRTAVTPSGLESRSADAVPTPTYTWRYVIEASDDVPERKSAE